MSDLENRVLALLAARPANHYTKTKVAALLNAPLDDVAAALDTLAEERRVKRVYRGTDKYGRRRAPRYRHLGATGTSSVRHGAGRARDARAWAAGMGTLDDPLPPLSNTVTARVRDEARRNRERIDAAINGRRSAS